MNGRMTSYWLHVTFHFATFQLPFERFDATFWRHDRRIYSRDRERMRFSLEKKSRPWSDNGSFHWLLALYPATDSSRCSTPSDSWPPFHQLCCHWIHQSLHCSTNNHKDIIAIEIFFPPEVLTSRDQSRGPDIRWFSLIQASQQPPPYLFPYSVPSCFLLYVLLA